MHASGFGLDQILIVEQIISEPLCVNEWIELLFCVSVFSAPGVVCSTKKKHCA